jgi:hypothetical protein
MASAHLTYRKATVRPPSDAADIVLRVLNALPLPLAAFDARGHCVFRNAALGGLAGPDAMLAIEQIGREMIEAMRSAQAARAGRMSMDRWGRLVGIGRRRYLVRPCDVRLEHLVPDTTLAFLVTVVAVND